LSAPITPDAIRDAKGWISARVPDGRYHEVSDQPALTALLDIAMASANSRSFRKLVDTVVRVL
jgi:hypothetical protein